MGDPARQGTHRLHLLRLPQLSFQQFSVPLRLLLRGHVDGRSDEAIRLTLLITQTPTPPQQPTPVAVAHPILTFKTWRAALEVISQSRLEARRIIGVDLDLRQPCGAGG